MRLGYPRRCPRRRPPKISKLAADSGVLVITAADGSGGKPAEFLVLAGIEAGSTAAEFEKRTGRTVVNWQPHTVRIAKGGEYAWPLARAYDVMYLRIEAEGYQAADRRTDQEGRWPAAYRVPA